jgi:anti-sigma regulatory factor (Ser/Thr protein kinase)
MDNEILYSKTFGISGRDFINAGTVSVKIKNILKEIGIKPEIVYRVSICCYEAEMNVVMYADAGNLDFKIKNDEIMISLEDKGPGIENIELALKEGYSTATQEMREMGFGAGLGLPNIKNNSDEFRIESEILKGTKLYFKININ